jgi:hypothetical protein
MNKVQQLMHLDTDIKKHVSARYHYIQTEEFDVAMFHQLLILEAQYVLDDLWHEMTHMEKAEYLIYSTPFYGRLDRTPNS